VRHIKGAVLRAATLSVAETLHYRTLNYLTICLFAVTTVRLKVEENQLVGIFGEIGVLVDGLKGA